MDQTHESEDTPNNQTSMACEQNRQKEGSKQDQLSFSMCVHRCVCVCFELTLSTSLEKAEERQ